MANIRLKNARELDIMQQSGQIVADTLLLLKANVQPGITTRELDRLANQYIRSRGAVPSFPDVGFDGVACISVNDEVVHGIPSKRVLLEGDIVSLDIGAIYKGYHGDAAITVPVGAVSEQAARLLQVTESALALAISQATVGRYLHDLAATVQDYIEGEGLSVVRNYVGHGIGRQMHEEPPVPNYRQEDRGPVLKAGTVIAIEPMVNAGAVETEVLPDKWTVVTKDHNLSAHFEHTVAVTNHGPRILTRASDASAVWAQVVPYSASRLHSVGKV